MNMYVNKPPTCFRIQDDDDRDRKGCRDITIHMLQMFWHQELNLMQCG